MKRKFIKTFEDKISELNICNDISSEINEDTITTKEEIEKLEKRRDMAAYQRKITTQLETVIEYDQEIDSIDKRLEQLKYKLKKEENL